MLRQHRVWTLNREEQGIKFVTKTSRVRQYKLFAINNFKFNSTNAWISNFADKLSRIPSEVAKQNASSAIVVIGVVCALALIVAIVVIVKRKSKNNIEDKEEPGS